MDYDWLTSVATVWTSSVKDLGTDMKNFTSFADLFINLY